MNTRAIIALVTLLFIFNLVTIQASLVEIKSGSALCTNLLSSSCEVLFTFSDKDLAVTLDLGALAVSIEDITSISPKTGTCQKTGNSLVVQPNTVVKTTETTTRHVACKFTLKDGTLHSPIASDYTTPTGDRLFYPTMGYFIEDFSFTPTNMACSNDKTLDACTGKISMPVSGFPFQIQTTSVFQDFNPLIHCSSAVTMIEVDEVDATAPHQTYKFSLSPQQLAQASSLGYTVIQCPIIATKSIVSPYFKFYKIAAGDQPAKLAVGFSNEIIYDDMIVTPWAGDCKAPLWNTCTLIFEIGPTFPNFTGASANPSHYFVEAMGTMRLCEPTYTIANPRPGYKLWCQTFREPLYVANSPLRPSDLVTLTLFGPRVITTFQTTVDITGVQYLLPGTIAFGDDCADENIPTCSVHTTSYYQGPPLRVVYTMFPYAGVIIGHSCNTDQLGIMDHPPTLTFPSLEAPTISRNSYIKLSPGTTAHRCTFSVAMGLNQKYDYSNIFLSMKSYSELGPVDNVIFSGFVGGSVRVPDFSDGVQYTQVPLRFYPKDDCADHQTLYCTIDISVTYDETNPTNHMRSFDVHFPFLDVDYTFTQRNYTVSYSGFNDLGQTHSIDFLSATDNSNPLGVELLFFSFQIPAKRDIASQGASFYQNINVPTTVTVSFRKIPNLEETNVVPTLIRYMTSAVGAQPNPALILPAHPTGFEMNSRPAISTDFGDDCLNPISMYCSVTFYRWDESVVKCGIFVAETWEEFLALPQGNTIARLTPDFVEVVSTLRNITGIAVVAELDFNQFRPAPGEPIPREITILSSKTFDSQDNSLILVNYIENPAAGQPGEPQNIALGRWYYFTTQQYYGDGYPIFGNDCDTYSNPYCTVTYTLNNNIPPNWTLIQHPVHHGFALSLNELGCTNTVNPVNFELIKTPKIDSILVRNTAATPIRRTDEALPIVCTIQLALKNGISPPRTVLLPSIIQNEPTPFLRVNLFIKQFRWSLVALFSGENCVTQPIYGVYECFSRMDFYGSPETPINTISSFLDADFPQHPLLLEGSSNLYSVPVLSENEENDVFKIGIVTCATNESDPLLLPGQRRLTFTVSEEYSVTHFSAWLVNVVEDSFEGRAFVVPDTLDLPLRINGVAPPVPSYLNFAAGAIGNFFHTRSLLQRYNQPQSIFSVLQFGLDVTNIVIETDFGFGSQHTPCIETSANLVQRTVSTNVISANDFFNLAALPMLEQESRLAELLAAEAFVDPDFPNARILGWLELSSSSTNSNWTTFTHNPKVASNSGSQCLFWYQINSRYPSNTNQVKHTIVTTESTAPIFAYQSYPRYSTSADLTDDSTNGGSNLITPDESNHTHISNLSLLLFISMFFLTLLV